MVMSRPKRQEQEDAKQEITEVAKDILRMELPISIPGLGHVNMYALIDDDGVAVIDPGLPGPATWDAILHRLKQAGLEPRHIHTVSISGDPRIRSVTRLIMIIPIRMRTAPTITTVKRRWTI